MLLLPRHAAEEQLRRADAETKKNLLQHFDSEMELVINKNRVKEKFWILGKIKFLPESGGKVGRVFLDASDTKPPLVKGSFVYEVDNRRGTKELLWWCDYQNLNISPTNKVIPVSPA